LEVTFEGWPDRRGQRRQVTKRLVAYSGCIFPFILDHRTLRQIWHRDRPGQRSNYGWLTGALVRVVMPELDFDQQLLAYGNDYVARMMRKEGFDGIAGKPFLDLFHWSNGEGGEFCLESWAQFQARRSDRKSEAPPAAG